VNIASESKRLYEDPFYESNSFEENLYLGDGQLYVLPPMSHTVTDKEGHKVQERITDPRQVISSKTEKETTVIENGMVKEHTKKSSSYVNPIVEPSSLPESQQLALGSYNESSPASSPGRDAILVTETTTVVHREPDVPMVESLSTFKKPSDDEEGVLDLSAWAPPAPTSHVVIRPYSPSRKDELTLAVGDLIGIEKTYDDGWARAQNITQHRKRGMLPLAVLTPIKSGPSQTVAKQVGRKGKSTTTWMAPGENSSGNNEAEASNEGNTPIPSTVQERRSSLQYNKETGSLKSKFSTTDVSSEDNNSTPLSPPESPAQNQKEESLGDEISSLQRSPSKKKVSFVSKDIVIVP
jgi:hypothetical protein